MTDRTTPADQPPASDDAFDTIVKPAETDETDATDPGAANLDAGEPAADRQGVWRGILRRNRALWLTAAIAVVALVAGLLLGRFVVSPDAAAGADTPEPGLVTVPVEFGPLSNDVTIRGEVGFADPVEVKLDTSGLSGPAVVTGQVPEVGAELGPLSIALEVAGRPVITLPGDLPAYRSLRFGVSGPDVVQFKNAMRAIGIDAGDPANDVFDEQAAGAVTALYAAAGYAAPDDDGAGDDAVRGAQEAVRSAEQGLTAARAELATARSGASAVAIREADNRINAARRELAAADPGDAVAVGAAQDALALAELERQQLDRAPDTSAQRGAVDSAAAQLEQAQQDLTRARHEALPSLPAGEVLYLTELPRRVDAVQAQRGSILSGSAMTVSGATVALTGSAAEADAALLTVGAEAGFELPDGTAHTATVTAVSPAADGETRWSVTLEPAPLTPEQIGQLQGSNVRVVIAVGATAGDVLSVPAAALTAGPGGETRVQVVTGDPRDPDAETRLVVVETGLSAGGAVEVRAESGELAEDDLVVVGR